jgi:hypothetical protein
VTFATLSVVTVTRDLGPKSPVTFAPLTVVKVTGAVL